jgi:tetratricopeptide (TPR) repeat protein
VLYNWADDAAAQEAMKEPLLAALRDSGNRLLLLVNLTNLAFVEIDALNLEQGEAYIVEADGLARRVGSQLNNASIDRTRGHLEEARGDLDLARKSYTAAVEKARQAGVPWNVGNYLNDLALLERAADRPAPASEHAREAIVAFAAVGDAVMTRIAEGVLAWSDARQGNVEAAQRRLAAIRQAAANDDSDTARFTLLDIEAHVAAASGDWRHAIELRQQTLRIAEEWNARGEVIKQQTHLAVAFHRSGDRRALEKLVTGMLPEVERSGLRGIARTLRALLASSAPKR